MPVRSFRIRDLLDCDDDDDDDEDDKKRRDSPTTLGKTVIDVEHHQAEKDLVLKESLGIRLQSDIKDHRFQQLESKSAISSPLFPAFQLAN